jgi:hypothetical protein
MINRKENEKLIFKQEPCTGGEMPPYEVPSVVTYREEEILEELGPAQAGGSAGSGF